MKPYTLTNADITLLANFSGALNRARSGLAVAERFGELAVPAVPGVDSVKWSHADELAALGGRAQQADEPVEIKEETPPLKAFETRSIVPGIPGVVYTMQADADGGFSVEVSGSPAVKFAAGARGVFDPARTSQGAGSASPVHVDKGEWCNWTYDAVNGGQTMRPQLL